ncbi:TolC family protein [Longibacter sp.]|uniref:TolC family protein n=1 Tax=Longibacter sp. TaxID=2045415 RepID=UPI003EBDDD19
MPWSGTPPGASFITSTFLIDDVRFSMMARLLSPATSNEPARSHAFGGLTVALLLVLATTVVAAPRATAQPVGSDTPAGADTTVISFDQAVNIALDQNTSLKRASNEVRRAETNVWAERMDWAPNATLSSGLSRNFGRSFSQEEGGIVDQSTDFFRVDVSGSVSLRGLGVENYASMKNAEWQATSSELSLERTRQDVVFQVMNRYIALVENREILVVQREELEARQQQLRQIEEFVDAGSRPVSALYEQQAAVAEAESNVLAAERDVQLSETRLIQVLRLDPMEAYRFDAPEVAENVEPEAAYDLTALITQAFDQRLDLRADRAGVQAAESSVSSARSQYLPTLTFSADYGTNWSSTAPDFQPVPGTGQTQELGFLTQQGVVVDQPVQVVDPDFQAVDFYDILDQRRGGSIGVSLRFPLFDGLRREQQVEEAQVQRLNAQYQLEDQRQQVALEVREAYLNYQTAVKQLDVTEKQVRAARQAREAAQERYNLGAASIVELTNANRNFVQAASQRIRARYNFVFQQKLIAYYVGNLNPSESLF